MKLFDLKIPLDLNWGGSSHLYKLLFFNHDIDTSFYLFNMFFFYFEKLEIVLSFSINFMQ